MNSDETKYTVDISNDLCFYYNYMVLFLFKELQIVSELIGAFFSRFVLLCQNSNIDFTFSFKQNNQMQMQHNFNKFTEKCHEHNAHTVITS